MVVNERVDVALAAGADGVHLPAAAVLRAGCAQSFRTVSRRRSVHSVIEAIAAEAEGGCDYLMFGTVFESRSKPAGHPVAGLDALARGVRCGPPAGPGDRRCHGRASPGNRAGRRRGHSWDRIVRGGGAGRARRNGGAASVPRSTVADAGPTDGSRLPFAARRSCSSAAGRPETCACSPRGDCCRVRRTSRSRCWSCSSTTLTPRLPRRLMRRSPGFRARPSTAIWPPTCQPNCARFSRRERRSEEAAVSRG